MMRLTKSLAAWGTPDFRDVLKLEIEQLEITQLPLQQGLSTGSYALDNERKAMIIGVSETADFLRVKAGIFYTSIIAGCSCADDPTPLDTQSEYCELQLDISRTTGETTVTLLSE